MILFCLALLQAPAATVGDTVWAERVVPLPPGYLARAPEWNPEGDVELMGPATVLLRGDTAVVRFPLVAWRPGSRTLVIPGPRLIAPDGVVASLPPDTLTIEVASVLPPGPPDSIPLKPEAGIVSRPVTSFIPLAVLLLLGSLLLAPLWWWWSKAGPSPPPEQPPAEPGPDEVVATMTAWAAAGEHRAVLGEATRELRAALAERVPEAHEGLDSAACAAVLRAAAPQLTPPDLPQLLDRLDGERFGGEAPAEVMTLYRLAQDAVRALREGATA